MQSLSSVSVMLRLFSTLVFVLYSSNCFFLLPNVIQRDAASAGICPSQGALDNVTGSIHDAISNIIENTISSLPECGEGSWYRVVNFEVMTGMLCPSPWVFQIADSDAVCGRSASPSGSCDSVFFSAGGLSYSAVCGRITGRSVNTPDGFQLDLSSIDEPYVDGVSITHSMPRTHIWTFAADNSLPTVCPCSSSGRAEVDFVGTDYFCDYGPPDMRTVWDGEDCTENTTLTCCDFNSPPFFSVMMESSTTDDIEVRICGDESTADEGTFIRNMELYIQWTVMSSYFLLQHAPTNYTSFILLIHEVVYSHDNRIKQLGWGPDLSMHMHDIHDFCPMELQYMLIKKM